MEKKTFLQGINYLKANYINWGFDINNNLQISVWYKKFANLDDKTYMTMIEKFTETSKYPPQSPAELLDTLRKEISDGQMDANEAWQEVIRLINCYSFHYGRDRIYAELARTPALLKTVIEMENELTNLTDDDAFTPQRFKKTYEVYARNITNNKISALIGSHDRLLLPQEKTCSFISDVENHKYTDEDYRNMFDNFGG